MLTDTVIKSAIKEVQAAGGRQKILTDAGPRGEGRLAIIIRATALRMSAEWYALFWRNGSRRLVKFGTYPALSLADARAKFRAEYAPSILSGANPKNPFVRRNNKAKVKPATVRELFEAYVEHLRDRGCGAAYQAERILLKRADSVAAGLGADRSAGDIKPADVVAVLSGIFDNGTPGQADATRAYARAAFAWGTTSGNDYTRQIKRAEWGIESNPVAAIPRDENASEPGSRFLGEEEFRLFWDWLLDRRSQSSTCDVLRLQMLTGQRVKELCRLRVEAFSQADGVLALGRTKNGRQHGIPLCLKAIDVMRSLTPNTAGVYFPHRFERGRTILTTGPNKMVHAFVKETKLEPFVPRDLRRTWKTLAGRAGVDKVWRDVYQNHTLPGSDVSSKHYDWHDYVPDMRVKVLPAWDSFLAGLLG